MTAQKGLWDAIVIGAGIQGCFTAYHLAKHSKKVLLLEQFFLPHSRGSSHGQSRIIRKAYPEDFYTRMMDECYQTWAQLEHETGAQLHRINVCYYREKVPGSYSVSQAFPCILSLDLAPHHIYGLPASEYPGLMKVCYHHGDSVDPEERDCPTTFSDIQDVQILRHFVRDHLPGLRPEPDIMERCMYTNTPDKHFILDCHPKYDNIVIGAGFSGHGFKLAPVVGKILYELSMKVAPSYDLAPFRMSRFSTLSKAHL
ncbi:Peroxisomal sarcosine oxidase [Cricetulus griseus]|uniref:Peroxisomal sarcosine oxidase n=1 Tax=Cricetulus griseus TaxID=10029 RepID=G3I7W6_CRIGR|nr:Peroxisomal sarcosine oxidase [Cricetulus griseus]